MLAAKPLAALLAAVAATAVLAAAPAPQSDLDALMAKVLARRDDNWKKLQQYILDEHEAIDVRGPDGARVWGERRDSMWYIKDGYFVQSPLSVNGVTVPDDERRKAEAAFLARVKRQEASRRGGPGGGRAAAGGGTASQDAGDVGSFIKETRQPEFVSSAYFLRFKFEEGKYALVGREPLDGRDVLRIEYYPARLFSSAQNRQNRENARRQAGRATGPGGRGAEPPSKIEEHTYDAAIEAAFNKVSLVTLWIDPVENQIIKYTFDNVNLDFLPAAWLVRMKDLRASMVMGQPFPGVWLPQSVQMDFGAVLAVGQINATYRLDYDHYRLASTTIVIK